MELKLNQCLLLHRGSDCSWSVSGDDTVCCVSVHSVRWFPVVSLLTEANVSVVVLFPVSDENTSAEVRPAHVSPQDC